MELKKFLGTELGVSTTLPWALASTSTKLRFQLKYSWAEKEAKETIQFEDDAGQQEASTSSSDEKPVDSRPQNPNASAWVVTRSRAKKLGCLHVIGRCYRVPGVHYKDWTEVPESIAPRNYDWACRQCFPLGHPIIEDAHLEQISSKTEEGIADANDDEHSSSSS